MKGGQEMSDPALIKNRIGARKPLGEEIFQVLKAALIKGEIPPGTRLVEEQLAENFGASRTPVRQAIHMLEREGLAERRPRGGFFAKALSLADAEEILDLRALLESYAAGQASSRAAPQDLERLTRLNEAFGRALEKGGKGKLAGLNTEFHDALYALSDSLRLQRLIHDLRDHFFRYRVALLGIDNMARTSYEDHQDMIRAMHRQDRPAVQALVRDHILKGKEAILAEARAGRFNG